ncbi:PREDICTED: LOC109946268 [Prunus dulcis]|uniref:PREDICTED: LOC109946268 n=1 Tax=Prunus dulcis TaxID=3755 RepID=A0A5E4EE91_PRUDU|nr:protein PFC0760c-like [Prunus dulcis]VVA13994.1 PREDICTED: LOC109946268 [Prunus dulcis]
MVKKSEKPRECEEQSTNLTKPMSFPSKSSINKKRKSTSTDKKDEAYVDDDIFVDLEDLMPELLKSLEHEQVASNCTSTVIDPIPQSGNDYDFFTLADIENMFEDDLININVDGNYFPITNNDDNNSSSSNNVDAAVMAHVTGVEEHEMTSFEVNDNFVTDYLMDALDSCNDNEDGKNYDGDDDDNGDDDSGEDDDIGYNSDDGSNDDDGDSPPVPSCDVDQLLEQYIVFA